MGYSLNSSKLDLTIGSTNDTKSYFDGKIAYTDGISSNSPKNVNYTVKKDSTFLANLVLNSNEATTSDLTLEDGAKYAIKDQDSVSLNTVTLSKSTNTESNYIQSTDKLNSTVIDLATNGIKSGRS